MRVTPFLNILFPNGTNKIIMKHLKAIEIEVANEIRRSKMLTTFCPDSESLIDMKAYIRGLEFCHKLLVNKISYLEQHPDE